MERLPLTSALEEAVRNQKALEQACRLQSKDNVYEAVANMASAISQLCRSVGLDYKTLRATL